MLAKDINSMASSGTALSSMVGKDKKLKSLNVSEVPSKIKSGTYQISDYTYTKTDVRKHVSS